MNTDSGLFFLQESYFYNSTDVVESTKLYESTAKLQPSPNSRKKDPIKERLVRLRKNEVLIDGEKKLVISITDCSDDMLLRKQHLHHLEHSQRIRMICNDFHDAKQYNDDAIYYLVHKIHEASAEFSFPTLLIDKFKRTQKHLDYVCDKLKDQVLLN
jgi:hypothetical protein